MNQCPFPVLGHHPLKIKSLINVPLSSSLNSRDGGRHIGMMLDTLNFLSWSTVMPIKLSIWKAPNTGHGSGSSSSSSSKWMLIELTWINFFWALSLEISLWLSLKFLSNFYLELSLILIQKLCHFLSSTHYSFPLLSSLLNYLSSSRTTWNTL